MKNTILKSFFNKEIKPNLESPNWVFKNQIIYKETTNSSLLIGFSFNSSTFSSTQFEVVAFIQPLYIPFPHIFLTFGIKIKTTKNLQWWNYEENNRVVQGMELAKLMNQIEDSFFSKFIDAESFYQYYKNDKKISLAHFEAVAYSALFSNNRNATNELIDLINYIEKKEDIRKPYVNESLKRAIDLKNIQSPFELLNKWLIETKIALKLSK
jgi:hypothetical protein